MGPILFDLALRLQLPDGNRDVLVRLDGESPGATLYDAIRERSHLDPQTSCWVSARTGVVVPTDSLIASLDLRWGDLLVIAHKPAPRSGDEPACVLRGIEGPAVGQLVRLETGSYDIGRGVALDDTRFADPLMSRRHARLDVGTDAVTVTDLGSSNGTLVDGEEIVGTTELRAGQVVMLGDSAFRLEDVTGASGAHLSSAEGMLHFNRQPRVPDPDPSRTFKLGTPPASPPKRRLPFISALAPLIMAGTMVAVTGGKNLYFLFIAGLSPVMLIFTVLDDRRSGRKDFAKKSVEYKESLADLGEKLSGATAYEQQWSQRRWPDSSQLATLVSSCDPALWWRRPRDPDFLDLRIGTSPQPSRVGVQFIPGGDEDLNAEAMATCEVVDKVPGIPTIVHLNSTGILGLAGEEASVSAHAQWLAAQIAVEQSPRDVAICVLAPENGALWESAKWLPHLNTLDAVPTSLGLSHDSAQSVFASLRDIARQRKLTREEGYGIQAVVAPHIVVFVHPPLAFSRSNVSEFLQNIEDGGISVIWLANDRSELPGECRLVVEIQADESSATIWESAVDQEPGSSTIELLDGGRFLELAAGLSPIRDTTASSSSGPLPTRIDLLELIGATNLSDDLVTERWGRATRTLSAPVGHSGEEPIDLDIELDGPHGLVAGTTGSGKSEFLQTLVASLALSHPPSRVNFVLIDYKGGSAFKSCRFLPHTVGFVTDLDGRLAERALRSLEAEQARREQIITVEGGAKDLDEFRRRRPDLAPPSLLIIVDEFAFLANEVPEFVDKLVDVAQRGRSLGVHLVLATQRPSGVISPRIQANCTLRVALRVESSNDSVDVIGTPSAMTISNRTRGRAYVRAGNGPPRLIQSAYVGGSSDSTASTDLVGAATFSANNMEHRAVSLVLQQGHTEITDLDRIVVGTRAAFERSGAEEPRKPWLDALPDIITPDQIEAPPAAGGLACVLGMVDLPSTQRQEPWLLDLDQTSSYVIYGSPGSGKTTLLQCAALGLARSVDPSQLYLYGLDFGHDGLHPLEGLPHWGGSATAHEMAKVERLIRLLGEIATERRQALAAESVSTPKEFRDLGNGPMAEIVVLVDNLAAFNSAMEPLQYQPYLSQFQRLVADGRGIGLHFLITADRGGAVPPMIGSAIPGRLILNLTNPQEYTFLGMPSLAKGPALPPGRCFDRKGSEIQIALEGSDGAVPPSPVAALRAACERIAAGPGPRSAPLLRLLPEQIPLAEVGAVSSPGTVPIGVNERFDVVAFDTGASPTFLVVGPPRSGRSATLRALTAGLMEHVPPSSAYLVGTRRTPLADLDIWDNSTLEIDASSALLSELAAICVARAQSAPTDRMLIVVDDADELADPGAKAQGPLEVIQKVAHDAGVVLLVAVSTFKAQRTYSSWLGALRQNQHGVLLGGTQETGEVFQARLPRSSGADVPPGRGYLFPSVNPQLIQVATDAP